MSKTVVQIENAVLDIRGSEWSLQLPDLIVSQGEFSVTPSSATGYHSAISQLLTRSAVVQSGEIVLLGVPLRYASRRTLRRLRRSVAILSDRIGLVDDWSILKNAALALSLSGIVNRPRRRQIQYALASVGLSGISQAKVGQLSASQRFLVSVAQAIVKAPRLVVSAKCWGDDLDPAITEILNGLSLSGSTILLEGVTAQNTADTTTTHTGVSQ